MTATSAALQKYWNNFPIFVFRKYVKTSDDFPSSSGSLTGVEANPQQVDPAMSWVQFDRGSGNLYAAHEVGTHFAQKTLFFCIFFFFK